MALKTGLLTVMNKTKKARSKYFSLRSKGGYAFNLSPCVHHKGSHVFAFTVNALKPNNKSGAAIVLSL